MSREDELDVALADTAVSAPFVVAGSQRLTEPIKLFLTGAKAATTGQGSSAVNVANYIEIGAGGIQEDALQALLQAAEPAPFGRNSESVLDPTYRNALQIKAGSFGLSAVLPTPQMLYDISSLMQPAAPQIFAQLHKVNVYGPGGMFKAHADTPTCAAQFGSLVVALPYEFEGGELVVTHAGQSATLTLGGGGSGDGVTSSSGGKEGTEAASAAAGAAAAVAAATASPAAEAGGSGSGTTAVAVPAQAGGGEDSGGCGSSSSGGGGDGPLLHFAAFFSDCIHEVLPVRSGHRVTLTFNLLLAEGEAEAAAAASQKKKRKAEEKQRRQQQEGGSGRTAPPPPPLLSTVRPLAAGGSIPFVTKLRELLAQDTWHPKGCTLGYVMQHQYATSLRDLNNGMFPRALKGGDRLLHAALCGELGLKGAVRPLHLAQADGEDLEGNDDLDYTFVGHDFQDDSQRISNFYLENMSTREQMEYSRFTQARDAAAVWIGLREHSRKVFSLHSSCIAYGNEPTSTTVYSGVALLLKVPAWGTPERARAMAAVA